MEQFRNYADGRLLCDCIYCGGPPETTEHVPSKVFLDEPFPANLPVVSACYSCNHGFSRDEQYVACLLEALAAGSADPRAIRRPKVAHILVRSPRLRARIEAACRADERAPFAVEVNRISRVLRKLAQGHVAYEFGLPRRDLPADTWWRPLHLMTPEERDSYETAQALGPITEVGSRQSQRTPIVQVTLLDAVGQTHRANFAINDWLDLQDGRYRYLAEERDDSTVLKMVIGEYLACQVSWRR